MIDSTLEWCTYRTWHASGFFYEGKGKTAKVLSGQYQGSGIRFKLALEVPGFDKSTWTTQVLATFSNEAEAYDAEAALVPVESLSNPYRLNMNAGGLKGKFQNHGRLYKQMNMAKRATARKIKSDAAKLKKEKTAQEIRDLKKKLKEQK